MSVLKVIARIDQTNCTDELDRIADELLDLMEDGAIDREEYRSLQKRLTARTMAVGEMPSYKRSRYVREGKAFKGARQVELGGDGLPETRYGVKRHLQYLTRAADIVALVQTMAADDKTVRDVLEDLEVELQVATRKLAKQLGLFGFEELEESSGG